MGDLWAHHVGELGNFICFWGAYNITIRNLKNNKMKKKCPVRIQKRTNENLACAIERVALLAGFLNEAPAEFIGADVKLHNNRILPFLIYNTKGKLNIFEEYLWCFGKMPKV